MPIGMMRHNFRSAVLPPLQQRRIVTSNFTLAKPAENILARRLRQLSFSDRKALEYDRFAKYLILWPGRMQSRFGWVHGGALYAEVKIFCGLTGAASWSGPSFFPCSCGRSAAANAAPGI
jgi:hypothetical protein